MKKIRHIHAHPFHTFWKHPDPGLGMLLWPKCPVQASPPHKTPLLTIWASINVYHQCFLLKFYLLALHTTKALKDIVFRFIIEYSSLRDFGPPR
jgi:hypothetical protein